MTYMTCVASTKEKTTILMLTMHSYTAIIIAMMIETYKAIIMIVAYIFLPLAAQGLRATKTTYNDIIILKWMLFVDSYVQCMI